MLQAVRGYGFGLMTWKLSAHLTASQFYTSDVLNAPDGMFGVAFDDGPLPPSPTLYSFLKENGITATHFMIGSNIVDYPSIFLQAYEQGDDIAYVMSRVAVSFLLSWPLITHDRLLLIDATRIITPI